MKSMIEAGAASASTPLEDQLASEKKCGHMGGKVLVPGFSQFIRTTAFAPGGRCGMDALDASPAPVRC
jgi:isocitrate lyase